MGDVENVIKCDISEHGKKHNRVGISKYNNQGCIMTCVGYNDNKNILIQFQDDYGYECVNSWSNFEKGKIRNPYFPSVYNIGITGIKYAINENGKNRKEYITWKDVLRRSFNQKGVQPCYKDVICCDEWLLFENFYEWLHSQKNFDKWLNGDRWAIDKDILIKNNKVYSSETCCLVPSRINNLFEMPRNNTNKLPIGVYYNEKNVNKKYYVRCRNSNNGSNHIYLGSFTTALEAFYVYKSYKENLIKQIAQEEYSKDNITKQCYEAMINYKVEITD